MINMYWKLTHDFFFFVVLSMIKIRIVVKTQKMSGQKGYANCLNLCNYFFEGPTISVTLNETCATVNVGLVG